MKWVILLLLLMVTPVYAQQQIWTVYGHLTLHWSSPYTHYLEEGFQPDEARALAGSPVMEYHLYFNRNEADEWEPFAVVTDTFYAIEEVPIGMNLRFVVTAADSGGREGDFSPVSATFRDWGIPGQPGQIRSYIEIER